MSDGDVVFQSGISIPITAEMADDIRWHQQMMADAWERARFVMSHTADEVQLHGLAANGYVARTLTTGFYGRLNPAVLCESRTQLDDPYDDDEPGPWDRMAWRDFLDGIGAS